MLDTAPEYLRVLVQNEDGEIEDVSPPVTPLERVDEHPSGVLFTVHKKESAEEKKVSCRIIDFARISDADVLVMGSMGVKKDTSSTFQSTTLGSSAHLAALSA